MKTTDHTARIVGALFLVVNITFLAGALSLESVLSSADVLVAVSGNRPQVIVGVLLELFNGIAFIGIAVLMFPILKKHNASLALGYLGFRVIEFAMQFAADISVVSLLTLGEAFVEGGAAEFSSYQGLATLLLAERQTAFLMVSITFGLGALPFYVLLYQSRLIPRFISVWGLLGAAVVLVNAVLDMLGLPPGNLGIVMLLNELFLGLWLIVRGFNSNALQFPSALPDQAVNLVGKSPGGE